MEQSTNGYCSPRTSPLLRWYCRCLTAGAEVTVAAKRCPSFGKDVRQLVTCLHSPVSVIPRYSVTQLELVKFLGEVVMTPWGLIAVLKWHCCCCVLVQFVEVDTVMS